ncbi:PTS sugar transporter subunit IIB [Clostridium intestinale]|uniref:Phosphotransferase system cellobiose-specific component IIB n=1 Tax=Clostridium intestinale URNW TaxID=1294142 RepID=U2PSH6_9CLOT|nr:PTS sugar transporter subunit IIB [Clostridium intestinale]ERK29410.1 phosphotransferase system cellobiose-specific component IIB [Clostridium intestinale URNW]
MTKKILLACAGGFSTSMLVEKMKEAVSKKGLDILIDACAEGSVENYLPVDIIMLGPQMGHAEEDVKEKTENKIPVTVIDMIDYGTMNGEKVLNTALEIIELNK